MPNIIRFGGSGGKSKVIENRGLINRYETIYYNQGETNVIDLSGWNVDNIICQPYFDIARHANTSFKIDKVNKTLTITDSRTPTTKKAEIVLIEWNCIQWQTVNGTFEHSTTRTVKATPTATKRICLTTQSSDNNGFVASVSGRTVLAEFRGGITIYSPHDTIVDLDGGGYYGSCNAYGIVLDL